MKKYLQLRATDKKASGAPMWRYILMALMVVLVSTINALAQEQTVSGTVKSSDDGEVLPGVSVLLKGTTQGTVTDADGKYQIAVPNDAVLIVSFVGFKSQEIEVGSRNQIDVTLEVDVTSLGEVVVIGYGEQRKVDLTGSVAIVDTDQMKKVSNSNMSTMLQGRVPGVQVTTDGQPGADPIVRIRGFGSFRNTDPLYVVDGVIIGTTVRDFSPNDIETFQVLKDASAAAIYGSRAANGVIIITTKQGKKNQPMKVDYSGYVGFDQVEKNVYDVMDSEQYGKYLNMSFNNADTDVPSGYDPASPNYIDPKKINTNWFEEAFKTGIRQNHNVNLSGGGANNTYSIGLDYFSQKGTMEGAGPNFDRFTARINNTMDVKFVKFRTGIVYSHSDQDNMALSNANEFVQGLYGQQFPVMASALLTPPTIKAYDASTWVLDGKLAPASEYQYDSHGFGTYYDDIHGDLRVTNVLLTNSLLERNSKVDRIVASGSANVDLIDMVGSASSNHKLNYNLNLSYSKTYVQDFTFVPSFIQSTTNYLPKVSETLRKETRQYSAGLLENTISYDGRFERNHVNVVVGQSFQRELHHRLTGIGTTLPEPYYLQVNNAADTRSESFETETVMASLFGRVNYDFDEKYLFSGTLRYDGSSRFHPDDNVGVFPSVSAGWRIDRESFFPVSGATISLLKIRGSYGELGNSNIGDYQYMGAMMRGDYTYSFNGQRVRGSSVSNYVNESITWEKKKTLDIGIDLALLSNQVEFTLDWYQSTSEDLLADIDVPANAGVTNATVVMNSATMVNSGFEFLVAYHNDQHPVKFDISANFSTLNNKVKNLDLLNKPRIVANSRTEVGGEIGQFYGLVYEGIFQSQKEIDERVNSEGEYIEQAGAKPGDVAYADINNDGKITLEGDQTILGSGLPKFNYGFNVRAEWKGIDLSIFAFGAGGFKAVDFVDVTLRGSYGSLNKSVELLNAWTEENPSTTVPRVANKPIGAITNDMFSQRFIQNASYLKLANIQLGYNFPDKVFGNYVSKVRIYATGQNLFTFTKYRGYNVDFAGGTYTPGYNYASYPSPRTIMLGAQFSF